MGVGRVVICSDLSICNPEPQTPNARTLHMNVSVLCSKPESLVNVEPFFTRVTVGHASLGAGPDAKYPIPPSYTLKCTSNTPQTRNRRPEAAPVTGARYDFAYYPKGSNHVIQLPIRDVDTCLKV